MILENDIVKLELLSLDNYLLIKDIASENDLVYYSPSDISTEEHLKSYVTSAITDYKNDIAIPFIIYDKRTNTYVGSTRFGHINAKNKVLHIGWTWLGKTYQGTGLNTALKHLMINYAFNNMDFNKIEFRIDERNIKSRKAVEKLGAKLEGILREDTIMQNGFIRSTCCYGILKREWDFI